MVTHQATALKTWLLKTWLQVTSRRGRLGNMVTCHDPTLAGLITWLQITSRLWHAWLLGYTSRAGNPSRVLLSLLHTPQTYLRNVDEVSGTDPVASVSPERHSHPRHMFHIIYTHTTNAHSSLSVKTASLQSPSRLDRNIRRRTSTHAHYSLTSGRIGQFHARQYLNTSTATFQ